MSEPIAAIATGQNPCAIGIVRVSGDGCFAVCDQVFRTPSGKNFALLDARKMILGDMLDTEGRVIDHGLAVRFPAPHSYTREDCAEFHCHGSPIVLRELLSALFAAGARQAQAGEFTKRAFLNGCLDLTQAEAVVDLIDAETAAAARNAAAQLDGGLRRILEPIQESLLETASRFYAVVDYPDEDIEDIGPEEIASALNTAQNALDQLLSSCQRGRVLKNGIRTAIIGRPNAGKSSLLNALAGFDRAIVTEIPGTTRDTVEESVICGGVLLRLTDTAGLRESADMVERLGVERSRRAVENADLIFVVIDGSQDFTQEDLEAVQLADASGKPWIFIQNKLDLSWESVPVNAVGDTVQTAVRNGIQTAVRESIQTAVPESVQTAVPESVQKIRISAKTGEGLSGLENAVAVLFPAGESDRPGTLLTDMRQEEAARRAGEAVSRAQIALRAGFTPDAVLADVEEALDALGELTGRTAKDEIVSRIFSRFCVGK